MKEKYLICAVYQEDEDETTVTLDANIDDLSEYQRLDFYKDALELMEIEYNKLLNSLNNKRSNTILGGIFSAS